MLVYLIFVLVILVIISWTLINNRLMRYLLGIISAIALVISTGLLTASFTNHYGLQQQTTTSQHHIYSASGKKLPTGILVAKQLGTNSGRYVMIYSDAINAKAKAHFVPKKNDTVNSIKTTATYKSTSNNQATVKITTTRWKWKNKAAKFWLNYGQSGELVKQKAVVSIPQKTWVVLSPAQLQKLKQIQRAQDYKQTNLQKSAISRNQTAAAELGAQRIKTMLNK